MKTSLSLAVLLGAILATTAPVDGSGAVTDLSNSSLPPQLTSAAAQNVEEPTEKSVSGSSQGPPVCGTCHDGTKQCCGLLVATGAYGCFSKNCPVEQQEKAVPKGRVLLQGLQGNSSSSSISSMSSSSSSNGDSSNSTALAGNSTTLPDDESAVMPEDNVALSPLALL